MAISIESVMHVNVNCSDLNRSLAFYRDFAGLEMASHTLPLPQEGAGFGLPGQVQWDAHILHDARGYGGPGLDLLEWKEPAPRGRPSAEANHLGFFRICLLVPDLDEVYRRARAGGIVCESPPLEISVDPESGLRVRVLLCRDPDGTAIEFVEEGGVSQTQLIHVNVNCSSLRRSREWYQRVLGLEVRGGSRPGRVSGRAFGFEAEVEWEADFLWPPGQSAFAIDLLEWKTPTPIGSSAASANQLGIYRMAFMVKDIHACHDELLRQGVGCPAPVFLDMGPEIPLDGVWALFFPDPDGTCLELIETPSLQASGNELESIPPRP
jgi:catechol 2,3-dioxygenase-like lactoylglutathione lyase family enzyme